MTETSRVDPYQNFRFQLKMDGSAVAAFSEATIPDATVGPVEFREGTDPNYVRKPSGITKYGSLTLKRGMTESMELYNWNQMIQEQGAGAARKNVSIVLLDDAGNEKASWNLANAWPSKYETAGLNASGNEVAIETFELMMESIEQVK
jgi:phage tail-like protein